MIAVFDAGESPDGAPITFLSCAAAHAEQPAAPDGLFLLTGIDGGAPFQAYCDMTNDNGGWMLVTPSMTKTEVAAGVTITHQVDGKGGLVVQIFPNDDPCGVDAGPVPSETITFDVDPPWSQIRSRYLFEGLASCWSIFGSADLGTLKNTLPFELGVDTIYDQTKMGGVTPDGGAGPDTFDGLVHRCDGTTQNFWQNNATQERSAVVILRRNLPGAAGLSTQANCIHGAGPGITATAWWEYREIYVR